MTSGPFGSYAPPGVYTETRAQTSAQGNPISGLLPTVIGTGKETLRRTSLELVRGSASDVSQNVVNEDPSERFVLTQVGASQYTLGVSDGTQARFRVLNYPIVRSGTSGLAARPRDITVTVDGVEQAVQTVDALNGIVSLAVAPPAGAVIRVAYFFKRGDTQVTDDVSAQVSAQSAMLVSSVPGPYAITTGVNDTLILEVNGLRQTLTLTPAAAATAEDVALDINGQLIANLVASDDLDNQGNTRLVLSASVSLRILDGNANLSFGFLNGQASSRNQVFQVFQGPIVNGQGSGVTTTSTADVQVFVDGFPVTVTAVDGSNRLVTLAQAPPAGSTVQVSYFFSTWQDTFDYLPDASITEVFGVGLSPSRVDYIEGTDYIIQGNRIVWGAAATVTPDVVTEGSTRLDDTQVTSTLLDDKIYLESLSRFVDRSVVPTRESDTVFVLGNIPTLGNGRSTPLDVDLFRSLSNERQDVTTNRPDLIQIYHGRNLPEAIANGPVTVTRVDGANRLVTVRNPIPPDHFVWGTYYYNRLRDDRYTLTVQTQTSGSTPGQYTIGSEVNGRRLYGVSFGTKTATDTIQWPSLSESRPDAFITGVNGVNESVTVTFANTDAEPAILTNTAPGPYDLYAGFSDTLAMNLSGQGVTVDLTAAGFGVLVSNRKPVGSTYTIVAGQNNTFLYEVDGETVTVTLPAGTLTGADIVDRISRAAVPVSSVTATTVEPYEMIGQVSNSLAGPYDIYANLTSTAAGPYDIFTSQTGTLPGPFDIIAEVTSLVAGPYDIFTSQTGSNSETFDIVAQILGSATETFNISLGVNDSFTATINGTPVTATLTAGAAQSAADVAADINAAAALAGLTVGVLTAPGNEFIAVDNAGQVELTALASIVIGTDTANATLGFVNSDSDTAPNELDFEVNGIPVNVVFTGGQSITLSTIISEITAAVPVTLTVGDLATPGNDVFFDDAGTGELLIEATQALNILAGSANAILGFTDNTLTQADNLLVLDINSVNTSVAFTGGKAIPTSTIVSEIQAAIPVSLTQGVLTTLTNDVYVVAEGAGDITIKATEQIDITTANVTIGFAAATYDAPNLFPLTVNGVAVPVQLRGGESIPASRIVTDVEAAASTAGLVVGLLSTAGNAFDALTDGVNVTLEATATLTIGSGTANAVLGFTSLAATAATNTFIATINGTASTTTFTGGKDIPASTIATEINTQLALDGLTVGVLTTAGNEAHVLVTGTSNLDIQGTATVLMGAGTANTILGFTALDTDTAPNTFDYSVNAIPVVGTFTGGRQIPASTLAAEIKAAMTLAGLTPGVLTSPLFDADVVVNAAGGLTLQGLNSVAINANTSNSILGFTLAASDIAPTALDFTANGNVYALTLTGGIRTAAQVATEINSLLVSDVVGPIATPGNTAYASSVNGALRIAAYTSLVIGAGDLNVLFGFVNGTSLTNVVLARLRTGALTERILLRSRVTPTGPSESSRIRVLNGNANATLGFSAFTLATGTSTGVNKPATLLSGSISLTQITQLAAANPTLELLVDGTARFVTGFSTVTSLSDVVTVLSTALSGIALVDQEGDKIRYTSLSSAADSGIEVGSGTANSYLSLTARQRANQRKATAQDVASVLNSSAVNWYAPAVNEFPASFFAEVVSVLGKGDFLRLTSFEEGSLRSIVLLDTVNSALNDTGLGWVIGSSASGVDAMNGFNVTSTNPLGSSGSGIVGQTYTDARTGLRFTVLPSEDGFYTPGESFTLVVSDVFRTGTSRVVKAVPGLEVLVSNTTGITIGDTAILETYDKGGAEPNVSDYYYITYDYAKTDFSTKIFTRFSDVQAEYGDLSPDNPLTLAAFLLFTNGAAIVALKQVPKSTDGSNAAPSVYIQAVTELERPLAGGLRPDIILPLTGSGSVFSALVQSCEVQSSPRNRQERRCLFGLPSGTRPRDAEQIARGLASERAIVVYPDVAIMRLQDETGTPSNFAVDGFYLAAAVMGVQVTPAFDVAEPLTNKTIAGFERLGRSLGEPEMNSLATSGVTVLQDRTPSIVIRHGLTTNLNSVLTATPSIIAIKDFVQKRSRAVLSRFIGQKFLLGRVQDVENTMTALLNSLVEAQILTAFAGVKATPDASDPTTLRVEAFYSPVFPLLYIPITFTISSSGLS